MSLVYPVLHTIVTVTLSLMVESSWFTIMSPLFKLYKGWYSDLFTLVFRDMLFRYLVSKLIFSGCSEENDESTDRDVPEITLDEEGFEPKTLKEKVPEPKDNQNNNVVKVYPVTKFKHFMIIFPSPTPKSSTPYLYTL